MPVNFKEVWFVGLQSLLFTCKISPMLVSKYAIIADRACYPEECYNFKQRPPKKIHLKEHFSCLHDILSGTHQKFNYTLEERNNYFEYYFSFMQLLTLCIVFMNIRILKVFLSKVNSRLQSRFQIEIAIINRPY